MRAFQFIYLIIFLVFYLSISLGTMASLSKTVGDTGKKRLKRIVSIISLLFISGFVFLYVWPNNARDTGEYSWYLIYNALLSVDFVFKIPLSLTFLIGLPFYKKRKPTIYFASLIISICLGSSVLFGTLLGKNELVTNRIELGYSNLPSEFDGYKVLQFSDTHLGTFIGSKSLMNKTIKEIKNINPDIVLFTGDLVNNFSSELNGWEEIFKQINNTKNSFAILGNHDYGNYSSWISDTAKVENFHAIIDAHHDFGFKLLRNENYKLKKGNDSIFIIGVENWGHPPFPQYANLDKAMTGVNKNTFKILLTHDPAHWDAVVKERQDIELSLSGHTHGLQWGIKKAGMTFSLSYLVRKNWGGLYRFGKSDLYVNTGLGMVGIPWRINMPGEITLITLKRIKID